MKHTNEIAIKVLREEYYDYNHNSWHYDREYKNLVKAIELSQSNWSSYTGDRKICFTCKENLPLHKFKKVKEGDYCILSSKGTLVNCKECSISNELKNGVVRRVDGKFQVLNWTKEQIIEDCNQD